MRTVTTETARVAIIGAGPIGIELAVALRQRAIPYIHLEAAQIGTTIGWYPLQMQFHSSAEHLSLAGVPLQAQGQQKPTREQYLAYLHAIVRQFDLQIRTQERVESVRRTASGGFELRTVTNLSPRLYHVDILILAIGAMHRPRRLGIPGEELPFVSHYFRDPHEYSGRRIVIVGGKNSAIEASLHCQRVGADVTMSYRRPDFDPVIVKPWLMPEIRAMVRDARVRFRPRTAPIEIRLGAIWLKPTDEEGRVIPHEAPEKIKTDFVLLLTGYEQDTTLLEKLGVELLGQDRAPVFNPETMETNVPGVFLAGTAAAGSPAGKIRVIIESCHIHVPRIVAAIERRTHQATAPEPIEPSAQPTDVPLRNRA
jgi:thioredoxin reductase (NADPH)